MWYISLNVALGRSLEEVGIGYILLCMYGDVLEGELVRNKEHTLGRCCGIRELTDGSGI